MSRQEYAAIALMVLIFVGLVWLAFYGERFQEENYESADWEWTVDS